MVISGSGYTRDVSGSSRGISNDLDRKLIGHLRAISDVVVTGGATARAENYTKPKSAELAIITRKVNVVEESIKLSPPADALLGTWTINQLHEHGFSKILLETGPSLSREFLTADLVDEICLTVTNGTLDSALEFLSSFGAKLELHESIDADSTLFTIWRRGNK
ncbi:MAG: hypothetical protein RIS26_61 [Actinomycetota bacterium]|jgi:riboflavin biosynthesis pyrimidine reductase